MSIDWVSGDPDEFRRKLNDPKLIGSPARKFLNRAVLTILRFARQNAPVDRGRLRQSITYDVDSSPMPLWGKVGSNVSYAPDMEFGTNALSEKPSATGNVPFPTGADLEIWARRHGNLNPWAVAHAIRNRGGLRPRRYLRNAFAEARSQIARFLRDMGNEIERNWGR
jgi:hypothetical protein